MKKVFLLLSVSITMLFFAMPRLSAQCTFTGSNAGSMSPGCGAFGSSISVPSTAYASFNCIAGVNYTISSCGSPWDSQITGYDGSNNYISSGQTAPTAGGGFYNDDFGSDPACSGGSQPASLDWTGTYTGTVKVMLDYYGAFGCGDVWPGSSGLLKVRQNTTVTNTTSNASICGNGSTRSLTGSYGGTYSGSPAISWSIVSGPGSISGSTYTASGVSGSSQTVTIRATLGACTSDVAFTVYAPSSAGTLSTSGPVYFCDAGGTFSPAVTTSGYTGSPVWDWGSNNGAWNSWVSGASSGTCCFGGKFSNSDGNADRVRVEVTNGVCPAAISSTVLISNLYNAAPTSLTSSQSAFCTGTVSTITLTAGFPAATNMRGTVEFSNISCGGTTVATTAGNGTNSVSVTIAAPTSTTTYYVRYNPGTGSGCSPTACAQTTVTVDANPTTANAGSDQTNCGSGSFTLAGNNPSVGIGTWSVVSGSATILAPNANNSPVTSVPVGSSATLKWSISNGSCPSSSDNVVLTNNNAATVTPGGPDVTCGSSSPTPITLSGASVGGGASTGAWSILSGGGSLSSVSQTATPGTVTYTPQANYSGTVTLQLLSNDPDGGGPCSAVSANRTITVNAGASAVAGGPDQACQSSTPTAITLSGASIGGTATTGAWSIVSGGGTLSSVAQTATPGSVTYTPAANFAGVVTLLLTTNDPDGAGPCAAATATRTITINALPTDIAPIAQSSSVCSGSGTNIEILSSQSGVSYQLRDNATNSNIGSPINGNGATVNLPTGSLTSTTTYNVLATVTASSCSRQMTGTVTVTVNSYSTDPTGVSGTTPICLGTSTNLSVVGGSLGTGATWHWYSGSCGLTAVGTGSSISVTPTANTTYFVRAEGTCNTTNCAQLAIAVNDTSVPATSITGTSPVCNGTSSNLSVNGGSLGAGATWKWYTGSCGGTLAGTGTLISVSPSSTTTYYLRAEGTCNNTACTSFTLVVNPLPQGNISSSTSICYGTSATLTFNFTVGTGPFNIQYTDGTNIYTRNNVSNGDTIQVAPTTTTTYTFTQITDNNTCTRSSGFSGGATVTVTPLPVISSVTETDVLCFGGNTGTISVSASSGTPPLTYSIDNGTSYQVGNSFGGLTIGSYSIKVKDLQNCSATYAFNPVVVGQPTAVAIDSAPSTPASCSSVFDGTISVYASGGTPTYVYSLNGGPTQPGNTFTGLASGVYTVYAIDNHGCRVSVSDTITNSYAVTGSIFSQTNVSCYGGSDGAVTIQIAGGIPPYSYSINGISFQATGTFTGLTAGNYTGIVRDSKGCTDYVPVHITQPAQISLNIDSVRNVSCSGGSTGSIYLSVTGGTPAYSFSWSNGATTQNNLNVAIGTYTVTVTDSKGCSSFTSATITQPQPLTLAVASSHNLRCYNDSSGSIDITVGGGVTPYTYTWSNGATSEDIFNIGAGVYSVTLVDANGCSQNTSVTVTEPAQLTTSVTNTNVSCNGLSDANVDLTVGGGTTPYTYAWNNGATTQDLTNVAAGSYSVIVNDAHSCSAFASVNVTQPAALALTTSVTNISCNGGNGAVDLTVTGGTANYSYLWSNTATTEDLASVPAGTYTVVVTDTHNCTATASATVTQPAQALTGSVQATDVTCNGANNGSVNLTVSGGTQPYGYLWDNNATTEDLSGVGPGTYNVTVTDANGCQYIGGATVSQPSTLAASIVGTDVNCYGGSDGAADLTPSGGNTPYSYLWSTFANTQDLTNIPAGNYVAIVTDATGCQVSASVTIAQPAQLTVTGVVTNLSCNGSGAGAIDITVAGGVGPYTYAWSNTSTSEDQSGLAAGTYSVVVTDSHNCTASASFTITQPAPIAVTIASQGDVSCNGGSNGYVNISVSGGATPYSYLWSNTATTQNINNLTAGSYNVVVTDGNGCTASASASISEPTALTASTTTTTITCNGGTANVDLTVSGGSTPYSYFWNNGATTEDLTGVGAGTYTVLVTDAHACTATATAVISQPAALALSVNVVNVQCHDSTSGSIDLTVSGGVPNYSYLWSNSATTEDLTNVSAGTYSVVVTDNNGCTATTTATITQPTAIAVNATTTDVACAGGNSGSVDITVNGGVFPYSFQWSNSATTEDIHNVSGGTYSVTITDANGCTLTESYSISEPTALTASTTTTTITCNGGTANVDLTVSGGSTPYSYFWNNGATTEDLTGVGAGTYTVLVTDAHACTATATAVISQPAALALSVNVVNVQCHDSTSGSIDLTVSGGVPNYSYLWNNSATTEDLTNVSAGIYTVVVTDNNGCTATISATVTQPTAIVVNATTTDVSCAGGNSGSVDITVNGGVFPYSFQWSNSATTEDIHNVSGGTYSVTITDANGCTLTESYTLTEPSAITSSIVGTDVTCHGAANGAADLTVSGGTQPYSYLWNTFQSVEDLSNISGGTYFVIVTDANGCNHRDSVVINEPPAINLTVSVVNVQCHDSTSGSIDLTVSGGVPNYSYLWNNSATTEDLTNVSAGIYSVVVTDNNGCTATISATVTQPTAIVVNATTTDVSCAGGNSGSVDITVNGGVFPYSFQWSNSATTEDIHNVSGGTYSVTITDANGCTFTQSYTVNEPTPITSSIVGTDVTCHGAANGAADLTVSGGSQPYTYFWSNFAATEDLTNIGGGTYFVVINDANGCNHRDSVHINEPPALVLSTVVTNVLCNGSLTGSIDLTVTGGVPNYSYTWSNSSTTEDLTNVAAGTYTVLVTDNNGCSATASATISQPTAMVLNASTTDVTCAGANNGSVDITIGGGVFPYNFQWSNSATTEDLHNVAGGTYTVTITDANGCTISQSYVISEPQPIVSSIVGTDVTCHGAANGAADLTVSGGTPSYAYAWSNFQATEDLSGIGGGTYYVIITDAHGCTHRDSVIIAEPTAIVLSVTTVNISCNGNNSGSIDLTVSGGTPNYTYLWSNNATTEDINNLPAGTYTVTVTDAAGCTATISATIIQPVSLAISGQVIDAHCAGGNDGIINVTVTGGQVPYQYIWSNSATTEDIYNLTAGNYSVTVTDANGCSTSGSYTVGQPTPIISSIAGVDVTCHGAGDGSADLTVSGGVQPYTFLWSNFQASEDVANLNGGTYYVLITDGAGCIHRDSVIINEPSQLVLSTVVTNITCFNANNGAIDLTVVGGTPQYGYLWSNNATTEDVNNLAGGLYTVTVTDSHGCTAVTSGTIANPSMLSSNFVVHNTLCFGDQNGSIDLIPSGGTPSYIYNWSNNSTTEDQSGLGAGTYVVTITDVEGCVRIDSATVTEPGALYTTGLISNVTCNGFNNGSVVITAYGGTLPYDYQWSNGALTKDIYNRPGGSYYVSVTDANGCQVASLYIIGEPQPLTATISATNVLCYGNATGTATVAAAGGTTPYEYLWEDLSTGAQHTALMAGTYHVLVTDSNNCVTYDSIAVTQPLQLAISAVDTNVTCNAGSNGAIHITVSGGTTPYGYVWTPSGTGPDLSGLTAGNYSVVVTDANSCTETASYVITEPAAITSRFFTTQPGCYGSNNGSVSVDADNGNGSNYTYNWSTTPPQTTPTVENITGGTYTVTITDGAGCTVSSSVTLNQPDSIAVSTNAFGSRCFNNASGVVVATVNGGQQPFLYNLGGVAQASDTFSGLAPGDYLLVVTDHNGCTGTSSFGIASPSQISVTLDATQQVILTGMNTQLIAHANSVAPVISYNWAPDTVFDFSSCTDPNNCSAVYAHPLTTTTLMVTIMNSDSCTATDTITITVNNQYSAFIPNSFTPNGDGLNDYFEFDYLGATTIEVSVYNRWGSRVYYNPAQPNGITGHNGWDGRVNGHDAPDDTYVYQLKVTYYDGSVKDETGTITIMR